MRVGHHGEDTTALADVAGGVAISGGGCNSAIGRTASGAVELISGNAGAGVSISGRGRRVLIHVVPQHGATTKRGVQENKHATATAFPMLPTASRQSHLPIRAAN